MAQIQILPERPHFGSQLGQALGQGLQSGMQFGYQNYIQQQQQLAQEQRQQQLQQALQQRNLETQQKDASMLSEAIKNAGNDPQSQLQAIITAPISNELKEIAANNFVKHQQLRQSQPNPLEFQNIENVFGKPFADLYQSLTPGGQTELLKKGLDHVSRGLDINELLGQFKAQQPSTEQAPDVAEKIPQMVNGKVPENFPWQNFDEPPKGFTPKDWKDEKKTWRKENAPLFTENKGRLDTHRRDEMDIKLLQKISDKLPQGFERILINPNTGDFYGLANLAQLASPEAQQWVKVIARFTNRAKDAYGARVTNFDLQQYIRQFPGLLNTPEGRDRILNMMKINNEMDSLYETALDNVYKKYGLSGIPQEKADELATSMIQDRINELKKEYSTIDEQNQNNFPAEKSEPQKEKRPGFVQMRDPQGKMRWIPEQDALKLQGQQ